MASHILSLHEPYTRNHLYGLTHVYRTNLHDRFRSSTQEVAQPWSRIGKASSSNHCCYVCQVSKCNMHIDVIDIWIISSWSDHSIWGPNVFAANGDLWKRYRRIVGPAFTTKTWVPFFEWPFILQSSTPLCGEGRFYTIISLQRRLLRHLARSRSSSNWGADCITVVTLICTLHYG